MKTLREHELINEGMAVGLKMATGLAETRGQRQGWRACIKHVKGIAAQRATRSITLLELQLLEQEP